jgi:hypothetical protein
MEIMNERAPGLKRENENFWHCESSWKVPREPSNKNAPPHRLVLEYAKKSEEKTLAFSSARREKLSGRRQVSSAASLRGENFARCLSRAE